MRRLDTLFDLLNRVGINLLAFNENFNVYNFQVKFNVCSALHMEVHSKCSPDEKEKLTNYMDGISEFLDKYDIVEMIQSKNKKVKFDYDSTLYKILRKALSEYEIYVREMIDKHGMDTKYYNEDDDPY